MKTTKLVDVARLRRIALGAVLTLAASSAGAFPFFTATNDENADATSGFGEPSFGLALNNAFDPTVLFLNFVNVEVRALTAGSPAIAPEAVDTLTITDGEVRLDIINNDDPKAFPDEGGTGLLNLVLEGVQYDPLENFFFINGPAASDPGSATGSLKLTGTDGGLDLLATPDVDESNPLECNFGGILSCEIQLGLIPSDSRQRVVRFLLDGPIVQVPLDLLDEISASAAGPPGQLVFAEDSVFHNAADPLDADNTCGASWSPNNALSCVGDPSRYTGFTPQGVPAPMTLALLSLGLLIVGRSRRLA